MAVAYAMKVSGGRDVTLALTGEVAQPVPLRTDEHGIVRVGGTRISLDTVLAAYRRGETPEAIVDNYDSLRLADVYAVIAYYLTHQADVDRYLAEQVQAAAALQAQLEADPGMRRFRTELQARKARYQAADGAPVRH
jgi:uncharacterized protein (DUF433 family)